MKNHLIITGISGCGKSTIIRSVLGGALSCAGGFITEREFSPGANAPAFSIYHAAAAADKSGFEGKCFLDLSQESPKHNNEVFRTFGVRLLKESENYPFILIDEFGGFEILIPEFREELLKVLSSPRPLIAVLKSAQNAEELRRRVGLGEKYTALLQNLHSALSQNANTELIEMRYRGEERVSNALKCWMEENIKSYKAI